MQTESGDDDRHGDKGGAGHEPDETFKTRLRELDSRLREINRGKAAAEAPEGRGSALGLAFRLAVELVAGLVVGGGIGWLLDYWLGTLPIMLLLFFALGAAAGILNVIKTAKQMQAGMTVVGKDLDEDDEDD
jgi:ATP synthase protein I